MALNAFGGGFYGMAGAEKIPIEWLQGTPFHSYFIPGFFLFFVVGGTCLLGAVAAYTNSIHARMISLVCVGLLLSWITIQVAMIGYVSWMQPFVFVYAVIVAVLTSFLPKRIGYK
jgi:hypothetical protein